MSAMYAFVRDINSYPLGWALPFATDGFAVQVKASDGATITVPSNFSNWVAKITVGPAAEVWVSNTTISIPSGNTPAASIAQIIPPDGLFINVPGGGSIVLASPSSSYVDVAVSFYALTQL